MHQLLIVDDEIHAVEGISSGVDWGRLGISAIFKAYTVRQAKQIFEQERIDIMLCDIEMPQATGLELTEWVRERYPKTETIFLTCHADFKYAKQALQLGSLDYLLKPVPFAELEKAIEKAKEKINNESEILQYSKLWFHNKPMVIERFWQDLLSQTVPSNQSAISRAAAEHGIPYSSNMLFLPMLVSIRRWHKQVNTRDEKILEYGLKNSAEEVLLGTRQNRLIISLSNRKMLAILSVESNEDLSAELEEAGQRYIETCNHHFYCDISCYIGENVHGHEMLGMVNSLFEMERNNVAYDNKVFLHASPKVRFLNYKQADMNLWTVMLQQGAFDQVMIEATKYLDGLKKEMLIY